MTKLFLQKIRTECTQKTIENKESLLPNSISLVALAVVATTTLRDFPFLDRIVVSIAQWYGMPSSAFLECKKICLRRHSETTASNHQTTHDRHVKTVRSLVF